MSAFLFERDLLYPTDNVLTPGIMHVTMLNPNNTKIPVLVEPKSNHSAVEYVNAVLDILQKDIFDRINIRAYDNTSIYIALSDSDREKYGEGKYVNVVFKGIQDFTLEPANEIG